MSIGEKWNVFDGNAWRPAQLINELGNRVELQFQDAAHLPDLAKTISTTREAMSNKAKFKRR